MLVSAQKLLAIDRPSEPDYRSVQNHLHNQNPLHDTEQEYILHKHDLITLRPGRDHTWFDRSIHWWLKVLHKPFPFVNASHISQLTQNKNVTANMITAHLLLSGTICLCAVTGHSLFLQPSQEDALKSRSAEEVYYTQARIDLLASSMITFMICALLIVPIYLLYSLVKDQDGKLDSHTTSVCIVILLVCTLLFSVVLSLFTAAKRHEILGAAAA